MRHGKAKLALGAGALALAGCLAGCTISWIDVVGSRPRPVIPGDPPLFSQPGGSPTPWPTVGPAGAALTPVVGIAGPGGFPMGIPDAGRGPFRSMGGADEAPLALGGAIHPLEPAPPLLANESDAAVFSNGSPFYVWRDDSGDNLMVGEVGGTIRRLAPWNRGPFPPRFSDGGRHLFVSQPVSRPTAGGLTGISQRGLIYPLGGGEPVVVAALAADMYYEPLPDGSGLSRLVVSQPGGPPAEYQPMPSAVSAPAKSNLITRAPGGPEAVEAELVATRHGTWSPDSRMYASVGFRNSDPLQGMDIMLLDRATKQSRLLYHLETDYFWPAQEGNFRWTPGFEVAFAQKLQYGASASIAISAIPVDSRPAEISIFPLPLARGESANTPLMAPDARAVAFIVTRDVTLRGDNWSATVPQSQGIWVCTVADGRVRQVTKGGRPVAWLPDGKTLICATGRGRYVRYYLVDTVVAEGGDQ